MLGLSPSPRFLNTQSAWVGGTGDTQGGSCCWLPRKVAFLLTLKGSVLGQEGQHTAGSLVQETEAEARVREEGSGLH
jgi:hypothetical protein